MVCTAGEEVLELSIIVIAVQLTRSVTDHLEKICDVIVSSGMRAELIFVCPESPVVWQKNSSLPKEVAFKYVRDKKKGIYSAMNLGVKASHGKFVYFSNPSDTLLSIPVLDDWYDMICFPVKILSQNGEFKFVRTPLMKKRLMPPHQGTFVKRNRHELFNDRRKFCGDLEFFLNFKGRKLMCDRPVVAEFRLGGVSNKKAMLVHRKIERIVVLLQHWLRNWL